MEYYSADDRRTEKSSRGQSGKPEVCNSRMLLHSWDHRTIILEHRIQPPLAGLRGACLVGGGPTRRTWEQTVSQIQGQRGDIAAVKDQRQCKRGRNTLTSSFSLLSVPIRVFFGPCQWDWLPVSYETWGLLAPVTPNKARWWEGMDLRAKQKWLAVWLGEQNAVTLTALGSVPRYCKYSVN